MGKMVAPTYATLVMGYLEIQFYEKCKQLFWLNAGNFIEENWYTFLEDCYIALDTTIVISSKLLSSTHKNTNFTIEQHDLHLPFLDILINKDSFKIYFSWKDWC